MASVDKRPNGTWRARWREYPGGPQKTRSFARKADAQRHLTEIEHALLTGSYVDPKAGEVTVAQYATEYLNRRHWRPTTRDRFERELRLHVLPTLGPRPLASLRRGHIEEWALALPLAPSSVATVAKGLTAMLAAAVDDGRIARNPASGARLPVVEGVPFVPMTADEVRAFVRGCLEHVRAAALLAAGSGLRQGELFGVTADRVDFMRRTLRVDRQLVTPDRGRPALGPVKSRNSVRTIALNGVVVDGLAAHVAAFGPGEHGCMFHLDGRAIDRTAAARYARAAAKSAGIEGRTWHDLRHAHASVLLSEGVSPALVAERLGHDVKTLLSTYAHVIRADDDRVRAIVDETLGGSVEDLLRTGPDLGVEAVG